MAFIAGDKIGPHLITGLLGKGGMGEVYRARDPRLERDVAIKVLPAALPYNRERLARFEREAKVLAALNHPNIATIYGLEEISGSAPAIVMELVEGPTLAERLKSGKLPLEETIAIARQIIAALEAAHEKGVVHRDLKPANVQAPVDADVPVKVLDFGLATAVQGAASEPGDDPNDSPTLTTGATGAGVILGTAGYMSPEQAAGKQADKRADIWSFGVVLWEMLTGERLFAGGETISHVLADVLRAPIDFGKIPAGPLRELLMRCLDRDVKMRLRDIGEARVALARPAPAAAINGKAGARTGKLAWAAAGALAISTVIALWSPWRVVPDKPLVRLEVELGADVALPQVGRKSIAISPDGARLAYIAGVSGGPERIYTRSLNQSKAVELAGTEGARAVFFSPDSRWIGFIANDKLNKVSAEGGGAVFLADVPDEAGADWGADGTIVVGGLALQRGQGRLRRLPEAGGEPSKIMDMPRPEIAHDEPYILPGGKAALITVALNNASPDRTSIEAVTLADGKRKVLKTAARTPFYLPTGHLIYVSKGTLFAVRFDPEKLETLGDAVPILDDVAFQRQTGKTDVSVSRTGTLVYRKGGAAGRGQAETQVEWIDAAGKRSPLVNKPGAFRDLRLSPDGSLVALAIEGERILDKDIWVYSIKTGIMTLLTSGLTGLGVDPVWTPDGRYIFYLGGGGISWIRANGAGQTQRFVEIKPEERSGRGGLTSFSPDGKRLAAFGGLPVTQIFTIPVTEENGQLKAGERERVFESKADAFAPMFSPDGKWIAYVSTKSKEQEVYVRAYPPSAQAGEWQVSNAGGTDPHWSRNELLYRAREGDRIMRVRYTANGDKFVAEKPEVRVEKLGATQWDVALDGRITVLTPVADANAPPPAEHTVVFLENFFDEVRRRVPVK